MKRIKLFTLAAVLLSLAVCFSGCIIIPQQKYYKIYPEKVAAVQFYDLRNCDSGHHDFQKTVDPVYTLPEDEIGDFLEDFSKLKFKDAIMIVLAAVDPSFEYGEWVVRIDFTDQSYTFYSCAGFGETFDAGGNRIDSTHFSCDRDQLEELIKKYYSVE